MNFNLAIEELHQTNKEEIKNFLRVKQVKLRKDFENRFCLLN